MCTICSVSCIAWCIEFFPWCALVMLCVMHLLAWIVSMCICILYAVCVCVCVCVCVWCKRKS